MLRQPARARFDPSVHVVSGIADNFNRADGAGSVANRSDGGLWTVGTPGTWVIQSGHLYRNTFGISHIEDNWIAADYGLSGPIVIQTDIAATASQFQRVFFGKQLLINPSGITNGYQVSVEPAEQWFALFREGSHSAQIAGGAFNGPTWNSDGALHTLQIKFDPTTRRIVVKFDDLTYIDFTDNLFDPIGTVLGLYADSRAGQVFDNVLVASTSLLPGFSDDFFRADSALGSPWLTFGGGSWSVTSSALARTGSGTRGFAVVDVGGSAQEIKADLTAMSQSSSYTGPMGLVWNFQDTNNYYYWEVTYSGSAVHVISGGVDTTIGELSGTNNGLSNTGRYRVKHTADGVIRVFDGNGQRALAVGHVPLLGGTKAGVTSTDTAGVPRFDNVLIEAL